MSNYLCSLRGGGEAGLLLCIRGHGVWVGSLYSHSREAETLH